MKTLMIEDLSVAEELDRKAMAAVRGGYFYCPPFPCYGYDVSKTDVSLNAQQMIGQTQDIVSNNGNNLAFVKGPITTTINPSQHANNNANVYF
jgi:hypothetical protein